MFSQRGKELGEKIDAVEKEKKEKSAEQAKNSYAEYMAKLIDKNATETPFVTSPLELATLNLPTEYVRKIEDAHRVYGTHQLRFNLLNREYKTAITTVGIQTVWLAVGSWVVQRGYRFSDPLNSLFVRWINSHNVRRLTTPVSMFGLLILCTTLFQLPTDVKALVWIDRARKEEQTNMEMARWTEEVAYRQGSDVQFKIDEEKMHESTKEKSEEVHDIPLTPPPPSPQVDDTIQNKV